MCGQSYSFSCGSNYQSSWDSYASKGGCGSASHAISACQQAVYSYQCNETYTDQCYHQTHNSCGGSANVTDLTVAMQDAINMGAGVQGEIGCTVDACGQPTPPVLTGLPSSTTGDNTDGDAIHLVGANSNTVSVLGDGNGDQILVDSGNSNQLIAGNGAGDTLTVGSIDPSTGNEIGGGNSNILVAGNGVGDQLSVYSGDSNHLVVGDGANDQLGIGSLSDPTLVGNNNTLVAGNGSG